MTLGTLFIIGVILLELCCSSRGKEFRFGIPHGEGMRSVHVGKIARQGRLLVIQVYLGPKPVSHKHIVLVVHGTRTNLGLGSAVGRLDPKVEAKHVLEFVQTQRNQTRDSIRPPSFTGYSGLQIPQNYHVFCLLLVAFSKV